MMTRISLIIFDLDGTLANSLEIVLDIYNRYLTKEFGCKPIERDKISYYRSQPPKQFFKELNISTFRFPFMLYRAKKLINARIEELEAFPNVIELVEAIHQQNIHLGLVTSNTTANAKAFLKKYKVLEYFEFVRGSKRYKKKHKKLRRVLKDYEATPLSEILYIGDEVRDIKACRKVNISCGAVTWGQASRALLEQHQPDYLFDSPTEILNLVMEK